MSTLRACASPGAPRSAAWAALVAMLFAAPNAIAVEPAVTVLADFEDRSVATSLGAARNVLLSDCSVKPTLVPARGRGALAIEVGATRPETSLVCELTFREPTRFDQAETLAVFGWINDGRIAVGFRVKDADGRLFDTATEPLRQIRRWVRVAHTFDVATLKAVSGEGSAVMPIEVVGVLVATTEVGRQTLFIDDVQVESRVAPQELVRGEFRVSRSGSAEESVRLFAPGDSVDATVVLENLSRQRAMDLTVELVWTKPDGAALQRQTKRINLPPSGMDFRSSQRVAFTQALRDAGLYRLTAQIRAAGWPRPRTIESSAGVIPSGRRKSRGRSTFFGVHTNLLRESELDRGVEVQVARDIAVNLLALHVPWPLVEPKEGAHDLAPLSETVAAISAADMALMLAIDGAPEWATSPPQREAALAGLIAALAAAHGERVHSFAIGAAALGRDGAAEQLAAADRIRTGLGARLGGALLFGPALRVDDPALASAAAGGGPLLIHGDARAIAARIRTANAGQYWIHDAAPAGGVGAPADADGVLERYLLAAEAGAGGLIWNELRDDDTDVDRLDALTGLVRRDFGPKHALLGYATLAAQVTGYQCAGPIASTPEALRSALFIGGNEQLAILNPRPNRVLPALAAVRLKAPGELRAEDRATATRPLHAVRRDYFAPLSSSPFQLIATLKAPQPDPQILLDAGWIAAPATVLVDGETPLVIELTPPFDIGRGFVQLTPPAPAAFAVSPTSAALNGAAGEAQRHEFQIRASGELERETLGVRIVMDNHTVEFPINVRPIALIRPGAEGGPFAAAHQVGKLAAAGGARATAAVEVFASVERDELVLAISVQDDRMVAFQATRGAGDELLIGAALEGADGHAEARVDFAAESPALAAVGGAAAGGAATGGAATGGAAAWRVERVESGKADVRRIVLRIPVASLGGAKLSAGTRLLAAVRYTDDDADGFPRTRLNWGGGLDGSERTDEFRWLRIGP